MRPIGETLASRNTRKSEAITSNRLIVKDPDLVEKILIENHDVVEPQWEARHAKLIYAKGIGFYEQLAFKARKYGRNPKALMGSFVNKELIALKS